MTEQDREALQDKLRELSKAEAAIIEAMRPFDSALDAVRGAKDALAEAAGVEIVGECEFCDRLLLAGDKGHRGEDGTLCDICSPTFADALKHAREAFDEGDNDAQRIIDLVDGHLGTGGSLEDKVLQTL